MSLKTGEYGIYQFLKYQYLKKVIFYEGIGTKLILLK